MDAFFYLFLLLPLVLFPVRFHLHLRLEEEGESIVVEMIFLNFYIWTYRSPVNERSGSETSLKSTETTSVKGLDPEEKRDEREKDVGLETLLGEVFRITSALRKYGLGGAFLLLFLPEKYRRWVSVSQELEKKGKFLHFVWSTTLGFEDPALSGLATGLVWAVKGTAMGVIQRGYRFVEEPCINVVSCFTGPVRETMLDCIFEIRLGHIIATGLQTMISNKREVWEENV